MRLRATFGSRWWVVSGSTVCLFVGSGPILLFTLDIHVIQVSSRPGSGDRT